MSVTCASPLQSGEPCGVAAVGRCGKCDSAYCQSHRWVPSSSWEPTLCTVCRSEWLEERRAREERTVEALREQKRIEREDRTDYEALLRALISEAPDGAVDVYRPQWVTEGRLFRKREVNRQVVVAKGWPLEVRPARDGLPKRGVAVLLWQYSNRFEYAWRSESGRYVFPIEDKEGASPPPLSREMKDLLREAAETLGVQVPAIGSAVPGTKARKRGRKNL